MSDCGGDCGGDGGTCDGGADTGGDCCDTGYSGGYEDSSGWGNDNYTHCGHGETYSSVEISECGLQDIATTNAENLLASILEELDTWRAAETVVTVMDNYVPQHYDRNIPRTHSYHGAIRTSSPYRSTTMENLNNRRLNLKQIGEQWSRLKANFIEKAKTMSPEQRKVEEAILRDEIQKLQNQLKSAARNSRHHRNKPKNNISYIGIFCACLAIIFLVVVLVKANSY